MFLQKGPVNIRPVEIRSVAQNFSQNSKGCVSQNGVKFRTICAKCNNELLGHLYDPELIRLTDEVSLFLRTRTEHNLRFPPKQTFEVKSQKLLRSLVGHTLSGFIVDNEKNQPVEDTVSGRITHLFPRSHLTNSREADRLLLASPFRKPGHNQRVWPNVSQLQGHDPGGDLIKFFPIAYWIVWDKPAHLRINRSELGVRKNMGIEDTEKLTMDFDKIPDVKWPENPANDQMILLCNQSASFSTIRRTKIK